ncbi:hypothetical protein OPT61_g1810 [Boeremia exigua]|uniref:Uncharacterized protein n=1 Tax=Boeremia exigua TaxID=749465 RepID=A0ACC2INT9_9PLEO|nr:hypothetical protein OPT61_g1810 [Boeremia exigua]
MKSVYVSDASDNWKGVTDAAERRKLQSRAAQRARRKRKHLERMSSSALVTTNSVTRIATLANDFEVAMLPRDTQWIASSNALAVNVALKILVQRKLCPVLREKVLDFLDRVSTNWMFQSPNQADLPTLTRLNALDALMQNASLLQIPFEFLETDDYNSQFNIYGPQSALVLPPSLNPTAMQKAVTHHSWLDLFPIPRMRDNILWAIETRQLDENQLCDALCCDLINMTADSASNLIIWGDPWDISGWEFSETFFRTWAPLLYGCHEVLQASNHWRALRGERHLNLRISG